MSADGRTIEQTGLIQIFRSANDDRSITISAEHTIPPTLTILKNQLTTPIGIALSSDGIAYDNGTSISNTTWTTLQDRIASVEAVAPNGGNATLLVINQEVSVQNADTTPTRVINTMAGDPTAVGEHFGIEWVGNTKPFIMESLDGTNLQIKNASLIVDDGTANQLTTINDGQINIQGTGLNNNPLLSLNTGTGTGILYQEVYNQRTAQVGEFSRMSFNAKNSNGTKIEYARIHTNASTITAGSQKGRIDLAVNINGTITDFLSLNGTANQVNCLRALDMNSNQINNIFNANTTFSSTLAPQKVSYLTTNDSTPTSNDPNMRQVYINTGVPPTLQSVGTAPLGSWSPITASATYNGNTYVGTNDGQIYYTNDPNGSWTSLGVLLNGAINCFKEFNGDLYFGGNFTSDFNTSTTYNHIGRITNTPAITHITWSNIGTIGLNGAVLCFETYNNYLYVGGNFFQDGGSLVALNYLAIIDTTNNIYNTNNNTTDGFNAIVRSICNDTGSNRFIIGGDFSTFTSSATAFSQQYYTHIDFDSSVSYNTTGFFTLSPSLNGAVNVSVKDTNTGAIILGGNFTSISPYTDYMFEMLWNGSSYQPQSFAYSAPSSAPTFLTRSVGTSAIYWGDSNVLYSSSGWSQTSPVGGVWITAVYSAWGADNFATNNASQNPVVLYYRNTSQNINITLNSGVRTQGGGYFTNLISLANNGNSIELMWNANNATWYVLSNEGATFS